MSISQAEFEGMINDEKKWITGDLSWRQDEDHSPAWEFRTAVESDVGYPLFINGWFNPMAGKLSYTIIHRGAGRIYALDLGADHHNPNCERVGEKHKHRWTEKLRDKLAYVPGDITATIDNPVTTWQQFCREARIHHRGRLHQPPPHQEELWQ